MIGFITALLTGIDVLIAFSLIVLILLQQTKGGGGLGAIGGESTASVFGAGTGNVLTKTTTILASCFLAITLALAVITGHRGDGSSVVESDKFEEGAPETQDTATPDEADIPPETVPEQGDEGALGGDENAADPPAEDEAGNALVDPDEAAVGEPDADVEKAVEEGAAEPANAPVEDEEGALREEDE